MVNQNYSLVESFATIVDNAFLRLSSDIDNITDPYGQQENNEVNDYLTEDIDDSKSEACETMEAHRQMLEIIIWLINYQRFPIIL